MVVGLSTFGLPARCQQSVGNGGVLVQVRREGRSDTGPLLFVFGVLDDLYAAVRKGGRRKDVTEAGG